jgi:DivIVA domain-containing protein
VAIGLTPSQVAGASFRTVRKGYDPDEVDAFLGQVAHALELAQQQATAMEARARAAVSRLQAAAISESDERPAAPVAEREQPVDPPPEPSVARPVVERGGAHEPHLSPDEAETISRTLLLAQHTADTTVADAEVEADRIRHAAQSEAETTIDSTREMSARLLEEARSEARKVG